MSEDKRTPGAALSAALYRIFAAIARVALRRGVTYPTVAELAKRAFIDVAQREFPIPGRKQTAARVSVLTGIHRKEIARVLAAETPRDRAAAARVNCAASVISGWARDPDFRAANGRPQALPFAGSERSFSALVRRYGKGDIPARAVLDELVRVGAARREPDGGIRLLADAYVPEPASPEALSILGEDVGDLILTFDHNLSSRPGEGFFQRKVAYDNIPAEAVPKIRRAVEQTARRTLEKLDHRIARDDRDSNPNVSGTGRKRVKVGIYYYEDDVGEGSDVDERSKE